jgi:hypothetical protein
MNATPNLQAHSFYPPENLIATLYQPFQASLIILHILWMKAFTV